jgi:hypothetical protein
MHTSNAISQNGFIENLGSTGSTPLCEHALDNMGSDGGSGGKPESPFLDMGTMGTYVAVPQYLVWGVPENHAPYKIVRWGPVR